MEQTLLQTLNAERQARRAVIRLTALDGTDDRLVREGETINGPLAPIVEAAFRRGTSRMEEVDGRSYFLNVHVPPPRIVVIGAVHISQALAPMAALAGYDLTIIDPRTAFATPERFAGTQLFADWPEDVLKDAPLDRYTALVAVTHDPKIDDYPIKAALAAGCFYVGALGSRKTHGKRLERLGEAGVSEDAASRIKAPIGLDIGAASPGEIAVAILAEIIESLRRRPLVAPSGSVGE